MLGLAAALPTIRPSRAAVAAGLTAVVAVLLLLRRAPDAATFDFALVRGPGHRIAQRLPAAAFPETGASAIHFRLAQEPPYPLGLVVFANGTPIFRREPGDPSAWPAFFTVPIGERETAAAHREGLALEIETVGGATGAFVYFPVVPPVVGESSTLDGRYEIPSGFGGMIAGGLPLWVTATGSSPRAQRTSVKAGKRLMTIRRKAPSTAYIGSNEETEKAIA